MTLGSNLKSWATRIARDGVTLWFAGKHSGTPWYAKALGVFVVAYALSPDLTGVLFATPRETQKYRNLTENPKVSLLINTRTNTAEDYLQAEAVTVIGLARSIPPGKKWEALAEHFLQKHPDLRDFVRSPTTALVRVAVTRYIHVGRFQEVSQWSVQT